MFIDVSPRIARGRHGLLWVPVIVIRSCRDESMLLAVDCYFYKIISNPFAAIFLVKRIPKNVELVASPPIEAPTLTSALCSIGEMEKTLDYVYKKISSEDYSDIVSIVEKTVRAEDTTVRIGFIMRRKIVLPGRRIIESATRIAIDVARKVVDAMCLNEVSKVLLSAIPAFMLLSIDTKRRCVEVLMGSKAERSSAHESLIFGYPELERVVEQAIASRST